MSEFPGWLPSAGPVSVPCERCRSSGLSVEHRLEWVDPPAGGWPPGVAAARLAAACRGCGSDFLTLAERLALSPQGEMRTVAWVTCEQCGQEAAGRSWAWLACATCGAEHRSVIHPE